MLTDGNSKFTVCEARVLAPEVPSKIVSNGTDGTDGKTCLQMVTASLPSVKKGLSTGGTLQNIVERYRWYGW